MSDFIQMEPTRAQPATREDRGLGLLRRRQRLRRRRAAGRATRTGWSPTRCGATTQRPAERQRRVRLRHVLRPPQRRHLQHQRRSAGAWTGRSPTNGSYNGDWNPIWDVAVGPVRGRLDGRSGDPVQVAALSARARADLGLQRAPRQSVEERDLVPHADAGRRSAQLRHLPGVARRRRWSASKRRRLEEPRDQAVRDRRSDDRSRPRRRSSRTTSAATSAST